jgi:hypothetical protein
MCGYVCACVRMWFVAGDLRERRLNTIPQDRVRAVFCSESLLMSSSDDMEVV